jgi:hypothetical protein
VKVASWESLSLLPGFAARKSSMSYLLILSLEMSVKIQLGSPSKNGLIYLAMKVDLPIPGIPIGIIMAILFTFFLLVLIDKKPDTLGLFAILDPNKEDGDYGLLIPLPEDF